MLAQVRRLSSVGWADPHRDVEYVTAKARGEACVGKRTFGGRRAAGLENDEGSGRPGGLTDEASRNRVEQS